MKTTTSKRKAIPDAVELLKEELPNASGNIVGMPFLVKVSISDQKGSGTDYDRVQFILVGVYTIIEVRSGKDSSAGWGRLKSGIGWISLDFVRRI